MQTTTTTRSQASNTAAYEANAHSAYSGYIYTPKRASNRLDLGCMSCGGVGADLKLTHRDDPNLTQGGALRF